MKLTLKDTRLLFLYRSFIFKFVSFETEDKNLVSIVNALNINKRKKRIEYIYDEAIRYINKYYAADLCLFENNQCIAQRKSKSEHVNGCCRNCHLVTDSGCSTNNLVCKLVYCKSALGNMKLLKFHKIPILKCLSLNQRWILRGSFFNTREEILNDLNYGIIYSLFRTLKKNVRSDVKWLKN